MCISQLITTCIIMYTIEWFSIKLLKHIKTHKKRHISHYTDNKWLSNSECSGDRQGYITYTTLLAMVREFAQNRSYISGTWVSPFSRTFVELHGIECCQSVSEIGFFHRIDLFQLAPWQRVLLAMYMYEASIIQIWEHVRIL